MNFRRLFFTYLLPLVPLTCFWDGFVSQLRAYRAGELADLARAAGEGSDYTWEARELPIPKIPVPMTVLIGLPGSAGGDRAGRDDPGSAPMGE